MAKSRAPRRPRRLRARPLLVAAAGAVLAIAVGGCGTENECQGICGFADLSVRDAGVRDLGAPADLTPRGD